jgi:Flp pilus assembly protein TadG
LIAVIGGMTALSIDLGSYSAERRDLQNAADAISLAASQDLPNTDQVNATANSWQTKNKVGSSTMTVTVTQQNMPSVPNPTVKITLTHAHTFTFARLIGITSTNVSATATGIKTSPGGSDGLVPWSVQRSLLDTTTPGQTTIMKYDSNNVVSGNFGAVQIDGNGANIYRDSVEFGSTQGLCAAGIAGCPYPSVISVETGNLVGPTRVATNYRLNNTDSSCDTWDEAVVAVGTKQFIKPQCNPFVSGGNPASRRILVIPVISNLCNGSCNVTITEFALFFLEGYGNGGCNGNHCDIKGRFISSNTNYGADVGVYNSNTLSHFVKLVQ